MVEQQIRLGDHLAFGHEHRPLDEVLKFANIAGPVMSQQAIDNGFRYKIDFFFEGLTVVVDKVRDQLDDVFLAVTQGGHGNVNDVEAIIEVQPEFFFFDCLGEIDIGSRDHPDINFEGFGAPDPEDFTVLQHPQQGCLHPRADIADFVEEDGPAVDNFKFAYFAGSGTGEGAFFVAKEISLENGVVNGVAVDLEKGFVVSGTGCLEQVGDQFFAGPRFAADEYGGVGFSHLVDHFPQVPHLATPAHHLVCLMMVA